MKKSNARVFLSVHLIKSPLKYTVIEAKKFLILKALFVSPGFVIHYLPLIRILHVLCDLRN